MVCDYDEMIKMMNAGDLVICETTMFTPLGVVCLKSANGLW